MKELTELEFRDALIDELRRLIPEEAGLTLEPAQVIKINDYVLYGITFKRAGITTAPTYYADTLFPMYASGTSVERIAAMLYDIYQTSPSEAPIPVEPDLPYSKVRRKLTLRVVDMDRNRLFLGTVPYLEVGNGLALVCDISFFSRRTGIWKTLVNNAMTEGPDGFDREKLFKDALINARSYDPPSVVEDENGEGILRLTTRSGSFGAAALFYPGMMQTLATRMEGDYYVLPAALHEVMIVPAGMVERPSFLIEIVRERNSQLLPKDVFTDKVFYYDCDEEELITIDEELAGLMSDEGFWVS